MTIDRVQWPKQTDKKLNVCQTLLLFDLSLKIRGCIKSFKGSSTRERDSCDMSANSLKIFQISLKLLYNFIDLKFLQIFHQVF